MKFLGITSGWADLRAKVQELIQYLNANDFALTGSEGGEIFADGSVPFTGTEDFQAGLKTDSLSESTTGAGISNNHLVNFLTGNGGVAAGTNQGNATLIVKQFNTITGANGTKGIKLPLNYVGVPILIANDNSGILNVYPNTSGNIDGAGANVAITLAANESRFFFAISSTIWVSAQFLSKSWFVNSSNTLLPISDNNYDIGNGSVNPRDITASRNIVTNNIIEKTADAGVTIETVLVKDGNVTMPEAGNVIAGTTTGTQIGTAASQKLSVWGVAPDVQPTTSITGASFVANTSGIADDTATWGGYSMGKVVAALKRAGLLA